MFLVSAKELTMLRNLHQVQVDIQWCV